MFCGNPLIQQERRPLPKLFDKRLPERSNGFMDEDGITLRKVDVRLSGKGNSNSHGARPVYLIITMIKWIWSNSLSAKNSLLPAARPPCMQPPPWMNGGVSRGECHPPSQAAQIDGFGSPVPWRKRIESVCFLPGIAKRTPSV